jgi:hypothetical protein
MTISYPGLMTREGVPILYHVGGGATIGAIRLVLMYLCPDRRGVRSHARGSRAGKVTAALALPMSEPCLIFQSKLSFGTHDNSTTPGM